MMKNLKTVTCGLLISIQLVYSSFAISATGTIVLRDKDDEICNLPAPAPGNTITYILTDANFSPCGVWDDKALSFQISEMPSATTILFANRSDCKREAHHGPWFYLRTTNKRTTTDIMQFPFLATYQSNQIVVPGLQMLTPRPAVNNRDFLSCVRITASPVPPSSASAP
jgi:hypothetical protein